MTTPTHNPTAHLPDSPPAPASLSPGTQHPRPGDPPAIDIQHLTVSYGRIAALLDVTLQIQPGTLVGVIGPNGSGKSTLIKSLLGLVRPDVGSVRIFGQPASEAKARIAYVPQRSTVDWDFPITVRQVARMGRYAHVPFYKGLSKQDRAIADHALELVRMTDFRHRQIGELSGGQQQRVFMARALAQGADILLLDEPFAGVDAATERAILDVLDRLRTSGKTLLVVHHDLATAAEYFDQLALLKQRLYGFGTPRAVLHADLLAEVYEGDPRTFLPLAIPADPADPHTPR